MRRVVVVIVVLFAAFVAFLALRPTPGWIKDGPRSVAQVLSSDSVCHRPGKSHEQVRGVVLEVPGLDGATRQVSATVPCEPILHGTVSIAVDPDDSSRVFVFGPR